MLVHPTVEQLNALGLYGLAKGFKELENKAEARSLDHAEWLGLLLEYEMTLRRQKQFETRARAARLRHPASVEDVNYQAPRGLDRALFLKLVACDWIAERRNLLVTGAAGLGKSWLACALGHKACRENMSVLYTRVPRLFADLAIAHGDSAAASGSALVDGCEQNQRARDDHGAVASGARFSQPDISGHLCARRRIFENSLYGLHVAQGGMLPVYYNPTNRKSTMVATNDIGAEVATLLTGPARPGHRVIELGSMVSADQVAEQLGEVLKLDVKAFAVPRAGWAEAFEQFGIPKGHTGPAEEMFEAVNAGWMDLGVEGTEHVAGTTSARDVFAAAQKAVTA